MWIQHPFFKYITGTILVLIAIYFLGKIDYFTTPFQQFIAAIFFPLLISGLLYYILRTPVRFLAKYMPKWLGVLVVFSLIIGLGYLAVQYAGSSLQGQVKSFSESLPQEMDNMTAESEDFLKENDYGLLSGVNIEEKIYQYTGEITSKLQNSIAGIVSAITSAITVAVVVPFLVFYFLKDEHLFRELWMKQIPEEYKPEGNKILTDVDNTLFQYIIGQFIVALVVGTLMFIGYLIIGLNNALLLALVAGSLTIVPLLGPLLGVVPAVFASFLQDPFMAVKVLIVFAVVQQLEGTLVEPQVFGKQLHIHPVTVILLLLAAGSLYGFVGILIAVPLYSVIKTTAKDLWRFYKLRNKPS